MTQADPPGPPLWLPDSSLTGAECAMTQAEPPGPPRWLPDSLLIGASEVVVVKAAVKASIVLVWSGLI